MSSPGDENENDSRRYWKAAISTLPNAEKRDAAWDFYTRRLEAGKAGDLLSALVLLLEANGVFLIRLPEKIHHELTQPIADQLTAFRNELLAHCERQQSVLGAFDKVQQSIDAATTLIQQNKQELALKIKMAVAQVDAPGIAHHVTDTLENNILHVLKLSLRDLDKSTEQAIQATQAAERSVETWSKIHIRGTLVTVVLTSMLLAGTILCWGWWRMEDRYRARLAAQVIRLSATDDAYRQLLWLGISIRLAPWEDPSGKRVRDGYTITIDDAEAANVRADETGKRGVVMLKAQPLVNRLESTIDAVNKIRADSSLDERKVR